MSSITYRPDYWYPRNGKGRRKPGYYAQVDLQRNNARLSRKRRCDTEAEAREWIALVESEFLAAQESAGLFEDPLMNLAVCRSWG